MLASAADNPWALVDEWGEEEADVLASADEAIERAPPHLQLDLAQLLMREPQEFVRRMAQQRCWLPSVEEFISSPQYLNLKIGSSVDDDVWPGIVDIAKQAIEGSMVGGRLVRPIEIVLTGSIGYGKSFVADLIEAYTAGEILSLWNPPKSFGLAEGTGAVMVLQSLTETKAKKVLFHPLRNLIRRSPWFQEMGADPRIRGALVYEKSGFHIVPVAGHEQAAIGENVVAAVLDEVNFMALVTKSKKARGTEEYDTAKQNYLAIIRRMRSRFMRMGRLPCRLLTVSSSRYPEDFTETKAAEAADDPTILVIRRSQWETKPRKFFLPTEFRLAVGGMFARTRILDADEPNPENQKVIMVPDDFRKDFERDPDGALRDIAGIPTLTIHPFVARREMVGKSFVDWPGRHPFSMQVTTLRDGCQVLPGLLHWMIPAKRAVHMDLAVTGDAAGIAIGYVCGTKRVERTAMEVARAEQFGRTVSVEERIGGTRVYVEELPIIVIEAMLRIKPPPGDEIRLQQLVELVIALRNMGLPIVYATADSYQSVSPLQNLWAAGVTTGQVSLDKTNDGYEDWKQTVYDERLRTYFYDPYVTEAMNLEKNERTGKVDHPEWTRDTNGLRVKGSKDVTDAVAGVVHLLHKRPEVWYRPPSQIKLDGGPVLTVHEDGSVVGTITLPD